jgi:hypothetical protein
MPSAQNQYIKIIWNGLYSYRSGYILDLDTAELQATVTTPRKQRLWLSPSMDSWYDAATLWFFPKLMKVIFARIRTNIGCRFSWPERVTLATDRLWHGWILVQLRRGQFFLLLCWCTIFCTFNPWIPVKGYFFNEMVQWPCSPAPQL